MRKATHPTIAKRFNRIVLHFCALLIIGNAAIPVFGQSSGWSSNPAGIIGIGPVNINSNSTLTSMFSTAAQSKLRLTNTVSDVDNQTETYYTWELRNSILDGLVLQRRIEEYGSSTITYGTPIQFTSSGEGKFTNLSTSAGITAGGLGTFNSLNSITNISANGELTAGSSVWSGRLTLNGSYNTGSRPMIKFTNNDIAVFSGDGMGSSTAKDFYFLSDFSQTRTQNAKISIYGSGQGFGNALSLGQYGSYGQIDNTVGVLSVQSSSGISISRTSNNAVEDNAALHIHGRTIIGEQTPQDGNYRVATGTTPYMLSVAGPAVFKEAAVTTATNWADFVFKEDYRLPSIKEVENQIKENGTLPNIPSAKSVKEQGYSLSDMDAKLLQKIEELTLYIIQLEKRIYELELKIKP